MVEQLAVNQRVVGSSPTSGAIPFLLFLQGISPVFSIFSSSASGYASKWRVLIRKWEKIEYAVRVPCIN